MRPFEPTWGVIDTFKHCYGFVFGNKDVLIDLFKKYGPYLLAAMVLSLVIQYFLYSDIFTSIEGLKDNAIEELSAAQIQMEMAKNMFGLPLLGMIIVQLFQYYILSAFAISWHRYVLLPTQDYKPMQLSNPRRHDIVFMLMIIAVNIIMMAVGAPIFALSIFLGPFAVIGFIFGVCIVIFLGTRLGFYFPAKAVNADITLIKAYKMSKGYVWKLLLSGFLVFLPVFGVSLVIGIIVGVIGFFINVENYLMDELVNQAIALPTNLILPPFISVIMVTVLSNYYQHALQNKGMPDDTGAQTVVSDSGIPDQDTPNTDA